MSAAAERDIARAVAAVAPNTPKTVERFQSFFQPTLQRSRAKMSCPAATAAIKSFPEIAPWRSATAKTAGTTELAACWPHGVWSS